MGRMKLAAAIGFICALGAMPALAQDNMDDVEIKTIEVADGIYMLMGQGGNIGVSAGDDGVFIIDDQFAPLSEKISAAIAAISDQPVRFVINTHWHGDHTGGNENFGNSGSVIVAHDNVYARMSKDQFMKAFDREIPAAPAVALPVITFNETLSMHLNGITTRVVHVANAHTDGDSLIHFVEVNVIHMGDTFFQIGFPFIDLGSGGSIDGVISAVETGLALADENTKIIPGHGALSDAAELGDYLEMLKTVRSRVAQAKAGGTSLEDLIAAKPLADLEERWGGAFINAEGIIGFAYGSIGTDD